MYSFKYKSVSPANISMINFIVMMILNVQNGCSLPILAGFWKFVEVDSGFGCFLWPILDFENCCGQFRPGQCLLFLVLEGWIKMLPNPI